MKIMQHLGRGNDPLVAVTGQTAHATPGTATTHTHGLKDIVGNDVVPDIVLIQPRLDAAGASIPAFAVTAVTATTVSVCSDTASAEFDLFVG